jgi:hypothetical protein
MPKFSHRGETYDLIEERFTLGEVDALERRLGLKFSDFSNPENADVLQSTKGTITLLWVSAKRVHPALTFEEVTEWVLEDVEFLDDDPTQPQPGESGSAPTSTKGTSPKGGSGPRKKSKP